MGWFMPIESRPAWRIAYFAHSIRSDWNNGNAHFLRGLLRALGTLNHAVTVFEPETEWSIANLREEPRGQESLAQCARVYADLRIETYRDDTAWHTRLAGFDFVMVHEWNPPALAQALLRVREELGFRMVFHDTHHRASSTPEQMENFGLERFDGVVVFGEVLRRIYRERLGLERVWTLHEAADTTVFYPRPAPARSGAVWIGNWGDDERSAEIDEFFLKPAARLADEARFTIYGVRYPENGLAALRRAGVVYGGYLPNLDAPAVYAEARLTVHIPRQQYSAVMDGIPTIRVFEALASGIPLVSAPWRDTEGLFRPGDFLWARNADEMTAAMRALLHDPDRAQAQAQQGLETVLARHTCVHRAEELTTIFGELSR